MHRFFIFYTVTILLATCFGLIYVFLYLDKELLPALSAEHGALEMLTAILFGVAGFLGFLHFLKNKTKLNFIFFSLMALAAAREMDWHKEWTTDSILKSRFYLDITTPILEKIIGGIVVIFLIYAAFELVKNFPKFIRNIWNFQAKSWAIAMGLGFLVCAKTLDSMARLFPILAEFHSENRFFLGFVEETFELTGALFFILFALICIKRG